MVKVLYEDHFWTISNVVCFLKDEWVIKLEESKSDQLTDKTEKFPYVSIQNS